MLVGAVVIRTSDNITILSSLNYHCPFSSDTVPVLHSPTSIQRIRTSIAAGEYGLCLESTMENSIFGDSENGVVGENKKRDKMGRRLSTGCSTRKKLGDISNFQQQQPKPGSQNVKQQPASLETKEYIDKLQKENMALLKLLEDRNKVIEFSGIELQKLRINFQKLQQQNLLLARANSQMLAEVNSGKDRLKALQHELGCKNGLLKAGKLLAVERVKRERRENAENDVLEQNVLMAQKHDEAVQSSQAEPDNKDCNNKKRRQSRNQSLGPPAAKTVHAKEKVDKKRYCSRRHYSRFKSEETVATEDLFEIDDTTFSVSSISDEDAVQKLDPASMESSIKEETKTAPPYEAQEQRRSSIGRPSRRAAEKVQSYKETPLNVKMRRED